MKIIFSQKDFRFYIKGADKMSLEGTRRYIDYRMEEVFQDLTIEDREKTEYSNNEKKEDREEKDLTEIFK